jgi:hypothetical protein
VGELAAALPLSPAETGVADRLVWQTGPEAGASAEWWTNDATLGRAPESTFVVDDPSVSRRHARLTRTAEGVFLEDLGSGNGTRLDGVPVTERTRLRDGGLVELGSVSFRFETLVTTVTAPKPTRSQETSPRLRRTLLSLVAVTSVAVAGAMAWKLRASSSAVEAATSGVDAAAGDVVARAQALVRQGRWGEARELLSPVWGSGDDPATRERWTLVQAEAGNQRRLEEAEAKLKAGDLAGVDELLAGVPGTSAQADRRDALRHRREALGGADALSPAKAEPAAAPAQRETRPSPAPKPPPARSPRNDAGPALASYLAGDLARARALSADEVFTSRLGALESAWQSGKSLAQSGNAAEAVRQLSTVRRLDAELSQGRASSLGGEASRLFAAQSYQLAAALKSDDDLGRKASRLAEAVEADPQERYRALQTETWTRCRELYQQAYVSRGPAPDEARQWFRTVCKCLPANDERQARACTFAKQLGDVP